MYTISNIYKRENLLLSYNRLVTNPESTYKNYFRDTYSAYAMATEKNLSVLHSKLKAGYLPSPTIRAFMPKSNGLNRMYTLLTIEDQIVYQAYANVIAEALIKIPQVKSRYKKSVFGNLYSGENSVFFYQRWQESYKLYTKAIIRAYQRGNSYIASFDLTACYDSINHNLLSNLLKDRCRFSENCANAFVQLLEKWESSEGMELGTGIPQGPQASGIVAEVVLAEYDSFIEQLQKRISFQYFRYVDDIRILADDEKIVRWVLFLLDVKSKELGLFPQSSKIAIHKINNIDEEIKRISKPLFDDEFDEERNAAIAVNAIQKLMKEDPADITTIKRYFQFVKQNSRANQLAIAAVRKFPNMIHSFAYYVQRYPRKIPPSIFEYVYECCEDKTQQFAAGILLEAVFGNVSDKYGERLVLLAQAILKEDKKNHFIVDSRYRAQLIMFVLAYGKLTDKQRKNIIQDSNWWVVSKITHQTPKNNLSDKLYNGCISDCIRSQVSDVALAGANACLLALPTNGLHSRDTISPLAQNVLKQAGIIQRSRYSNSQISRYFKEIADIKSTFQWKKKLGKEHDNIERTLFTALGYWKTDLTAFVNLWDTLDDRLCSIVTQAHPQLGGYTLGKIGAIEKSKGFISNLPKFHKMCMSMHALRLASHLSHSEVKRTHTYTGPISQQKRKEIKRLIKEGMTELLAFW